MTWHCFGLRPEMQKVLVCVYMVWFLWFNCVIFLWPTDLDPQTLLVSSPAADNINISKHAVVHVHSRCYSASVTIDKAAVMLIVLRRLRSQRIAHPSRSLLIYNLYAESDRNVGHSHCHCCIVLIMRSIAINRRLHYGLHAVGPSVYPACLLLKVKVYPYS